MPWQSKRECGVVGEPETWPDGARNHLVCGSLLRRFRLSASPFPELRSTDAFTLCRAGLAVITMGIVEQMWFDPYDWNPGMGAFIVGHGHVSDDVVLDLGDAGVGHDYRLENRYTQSPTGA